MMDASHTQIHHEIESHNGEDQMFVNMCDCNVLSKSKIADPKIWLFNLTIVKQ